MAGIYAAETPERREWMSYAPLDASAVTRLRAAAADVREGFRRHRAWRYLAAEQVKNSYRRTVLGPWWLTAQTAVYVLGLAFVFAQLLDAHLKSFLPYVAVGFLCYALLAGLVRAAAGVFTNNASLIKSTRQPLASLVLRSVAVELIQFGHNAIIIVMFFAAGLIDPSRWVLATPLALGVILVNGFLAGLWLGPTVARFRDVGPAVDSVLQVIIFFTPVFYKPSDLHGAQAALVGWNPFTYFIDLMRSCVLGHAPSWGTLIGSGAFTLANVTLAAVVFSRSRSRLPYWVS
jgi:lipopolysaccharide transport system permease protein